MCRRKIAVIRWEKTAPSIISRYRLRRRRSFTLHLPSPVCNVCVKNKIAVETKTRNGELTICSWNMTSQCHVLALIIIMVLFPVSSSSFLSHISQRKCPKNFNHCHVLYLLLVLPAITFSRTAVHRLHLHSQCSAHSMEKVEVKWSGVTSRTNKSFFLLPSPCTRWSHFIIVVHLMCIYSHSNRSTSSEISKW